MSAIAFFASFHFYHQILLQLQESDSAQRMAEENKALVIRLATEKLQQQVDGLVFRLQTAEVQKGELFFLAGCPGNCLYPVFNLFIFFKTKFFFFDSNLAYHIKFLRLHFVFQSLD